MDTAAGRVLPARSQLLARVDDVPRSARPDPRLKARHRPLKALGKRMKRPGGRPPWEASRTASWPAVRRDPTPGPSDRTLPASSRLRRTTGLLVADGAEETRVRRIAIWAGGHARTACRSQRQGGANALPVETPTSSRSPRRAKVDAVVEDSTYVRWRVPATAASGRATASARWACLALHRGPRALRGGAGDQDLLASGELRRTKRWEAEPGRASMSRRPAPDVRPRRHRRRPWLATAVRP
jgi:hypothetical protein